MSDSQTNPQTNPQIDPLVGATAWIQAAIPEPTEKDRSTQLGVFLEELSETLQELSTEDADVALVLKNAIQSLHLLAEHSKSQGSIFILPGNRLHFLDGLCDMIQTAASTAHVNKMDLVGGMSNVVESNFSKFVDGKPLFNENKKVMKGPDYFKPDLAQFI